MTNLRWLALAAAVTALSPAERADGASRCVDVSVPRKAVEAENGQWIGVARQGAMGAQRLDRVGLG